MATQFPAELVLEYLEAVLEVNPESENLRDIDQELFKAAKHFFSNPHWDWDITGIEPALILDIIIAECLLMNKARCCDMEHILAATYYPWFNDVFFDPEPNPTLSIAGHLNANYARIVEETTGELPIGSLYPAVEIIRKLIAASPTSDEMVTDYIKDVYLSLNEHTEQDDRWYFFYNEAADLMYELTKAINFAKPDLRILRNSFEDDLPFILGQLLLNDLIDFKETFTSEINEEDYHEHPLTLLVHQLDILADELLVD